MKSEIGQTLKQGGGAILSTSSVAGLRRIPGRAAYAASKHGIIGFTKTAVQEYGKVTIGINSVCPGWIRTPVIEAVINREPGLEARKKSLEPVGRTGNPEKVAEAVVWQYDVASFVTGHLRVPAGRFVCRIGGGCFSKVGGATTRRTCKKNLYKRVEEGRNSDILKETKAYS